MRIAVIGPVHPYRGGVSQFNTRLVEELRKGTDVLVASWSHQFPNWLYPGGEQWSAHPATVESHHTRFELDYRSPASIARTVRTLRRWRADAVVLSWTTTFAGPHYLILLALLRRAAPPIGVVAICHNVLPHERRPGDRLLTRAVLGRVDAIVVHASAQVTELMRVVPAVRHRVLQMPEIGPRPPAADHEAIRRATRDRLGLGGRVLLFFGYVRPYKGLADLIDAMALLDHSLGVQLVVAGQFWEPIAGYARQIEAHGLSNRIKLINGYLDDIESSQLLLAADVVVLPYREATQSAVVPLAFAHDRPVISTTVGGLPELVEKDVTGLLVPPGRPDLLAEAIKRFYHDDLANILRPGVRARRPDDWAQYADALKSVLSAAAKNRA